MGPVLGPHARNDRTPDTRVAGPRLPAPEDGRPGKGQRLTPYAPRNDGRQRPPGTPFGHPYNGQRTTAPTHQPRDIRTPPPALRHSEGPPSPRGHHPHHRPCRGLHHRSIRHPPPNAGPAPQRGTPHPLSTASRMATIPPLPPVPHADGTSSGTHSTGKQRHAHSLPRIHKATHLTHPSDTALRTHRIETRTRPPGDGPSPTTNPTTGPE